MGYTEWNYSTIELAAVGAGGAVVALGGLWLENRCGPRLGRLWAGILALGFAGLAVAVWLLSGEPALSGPFVALTAFCLAAAALSMPPVQRLARRLVEPKVVWVLLLIAAPTFAVVGAFYAKEAELSFPLEEYSTAELVQTSQGHVFTDLGREIPLYAYTEIEPLKEAEELMLAVEHFKNHVIRLAGPDLACNCHGWVFIAGHAAIPSERVDSILSDNAYVEVAVPAEDDLIVYRDPEGIVLHSGIVRHAGERGVVLVESKWAALGVYLHSPEVQPWGNHYAFYHSPRKGHLLRVTPGPGRKERPGAELPGLGAGAGGVPGPASVPGH